MTTPNRRVRHLRLRAGNQADVGRVLPVLEDALRCASLPDTGSRLLLVRRLALGRIARDASAQALASVIEKRVAEVGGQWVEGGTAAAAGAAYVSFAGALEARTRLALRLARGAPHTEWYWPLAVPELRAAEGRSDALRRIAQAMAQWPEARRALPAWVAALVQAGQGGCLASAISASEGAALVRQVGLVMQDLPVQPGRGQVSPPAEEAAPEAWLNVPERAEPRWMRSLLAAAQPHRPALRGHPATTEHSSEAAHPAAAAAARDGRAGELPASTPHGTAPLAPARAYLGRAIDRSEPKGAQEARTDPVPTARGRQEAAKDWPLPPLSRPSQAMPLAEPPKRPADDPLPAAPLWQHPARFDAEPTACAGLLFLLPVLARLGLPQWLAEAPDAGFTPRVLQQALRRLRVPVHDPAWALVAAGVAEAGMQAAPAPACWSDPLLAGSPDLTQALHAATDPDAQAAMWLTAARRWLRRAGRIGLASLVLRPGFIGLSPTHADLHFRLHDTDLRVRRLGLDLDPGWLPWFGRVVAFHYHRALP